MDGLTQSYIFRQKLQNCEPIYLSRFVVDLRERTRQQTLYLYQKVKTTEAIKTGVVPRNKEKYQFWVGGGVGFSSCSFKHAPFSSTHFQVFL